MKPTILVVDDDAELRALLSEQLAPRFATVEAPDATHALRALAAHTIDAVVTDLRMPGRSGTDLCAELVRLRPDVPVLIMTAFGSLDAAVDAIRAGAYDFLVKPFESERLELALERALTERRLREEVRHLRRRTGEHAGYEGMLGTSPPMERLYQLLDRVGSSDAAVLVLGESGTGKELVARALHARSRRRDHPFVALNCAAMPEALLESELFGHAKGAFTDAREDRRGLLREAEGGTLFLDEIGDLAPSLQPKLLRAIQERRVRPVGAEMEVPVDVRILAATHRDLRADVEAGRFRADLFYRLNVIAIDVPPLRDRGDDVLLLAEELTDEVARRDGKPAPEISEEVASVLLSYAWPGNVRELRNCVERCVALATDTIELEHLPEEVQGVAPSNRAPVGTDAEARFASLEDVERRHLLRVYEAVDGNKSRAARILGIDRKTLHTRLSRYGRD